jgi:hypothetical protein
VCESEESDEVSDWMCHPMPSTRGKIRMG